MEKAITRKSFEITKTVTKFWQQAAIVCCMFFMFTIGQVYSQCIPVTSTTSDLATCEGNPATISHATGGYTHANEINSNWYMSTTGPGGPFIPLTEGQGGVFTNVHGHTLQISDVTGLNGYYFREESDLDPAIYCVSHIASTPPALLSVYPSPAISVVSDPQSPVCSGAATTLTANVTNTPNSPEPFTYIWFNPTITPGTKSVVVNPTISTTYHVQVIDFHNCFASSSITVDVNNPPTVSCSILPESGKVCVGDDVTFTGTLLSGTNNDGCPVTYEWKNPNGDVVSTSLTLDLNDVTIDAAGIYTFKATNCCGSASCTKELIVNTAPVITSFTSTENCIPLPTAPARTFIFTVTATGSQPLNYQWSKNGVDLVGETNTSFSITTNNPANDQGIYKVVVSNNCGNTSASATIAPCACTPPSILEQPANQEVCQGQTATFTVVANGTPPLMYQWFKLGGTILNGETKDTFITSVAGTYYVVVTNDPTNCGESLTSNNAVLTVNPNLNITCMPSNTNTTAGASVVFSVNVIAGVDVKFQWKFDGVDLAGQTNSSYTRSILATDNGKQVCVNVTAKCGQPVNCCTTINIPVTCIGFATLTQGGWGTVAHGGNPGTLRNKYFATVFPNGLEIGREPNFHLILTSSLAVQNYLPDGTGPKAYTKNYLNPTTKITVLSGQLTALKLNVYFGAAGYLGTNKNLGNLCFTSGVLAGKNVYQFLAMADEAIGGGSLGGLTLSQYNDIATAINEGFDEGANHIGSLLSCNCILPGVSKASKLTSDNAVNTAEMMTIYPNPTNGLIEVAIPGSFTESNLSIFNINGQLVYNAKVSSSDGNVKQIDMSSKGTGIYFVKLTNGQNVKTIKLIVQ